MVPLNVYLAGNHTETQLSVRDGETEWEEGVMQVGKRRESTMNPLWVFSRFSRSKHNEFWSRHHCINSVTVQLLWPVISLVYNLQGGKLSTAKKIQLLQAPVASFVCAELF